MIASNIALTAAHCLHDDDGQPIAAQNLHFLAGYHVGASVADTGVLRWVAGLGFRDEGAVALSAANIRNDVALVLLDRPLPRDAVVPIALHSGLLRNNQVRVLSYGGATGQVLSPLLPCALLHRFADGVMEFDCDVSFGASGAPVLAGHDGRLSILSLVSAIGQADDGAARSFGTTLPGQVAILRARLNRPPAGTTASDGARRIRAGDRSSGSARFVRP